MARSFRSTDSSTLVKTAVACTVGLAAAGVGLFEGVDALVHAAQASYWYPVELSGGAIGAAVAGWGVEQLGQAAESPGITAVGTLGKVGGSVMGGLGSAALIFGPAAHTTLHPEVVGLISAGIAATWANRATKGLED
jgi:hypothetical protein